MPPNVSSPDVRSGALRRVARNRAGFWFALLLSAIVIALTGVAIFLGSIFFLDGLIPPSFWPATQMLLALAPALIWLLFFIPGVRDGVVSRSSVLILFLSGALYIVTVYPLIHQVYAVDEWLYISWWSELLGRFLVIAPLETLFIYIILRYGVYPTQAFQRLVDGPLYGVAAGLGVAAIISLLQAASIGFADLSQGALFTSEMAVGFATLAALLGYFVGQARFRRTHIFYPAAGLALVVLLHALFFFTLNFIKAQNLFLPSLAGLSFAFTFALLIFGIIFWQIRKSHQAFIRMAALVEIQEEAERPPSLLADVRQMVETNQLETPPSPPSPPPRVLLRDDKNNDEGDELTNLKKNWESLIAEQEASHD